MEGVSDWRVPSGARPLPAGRPARRRQHPRRGSFVQACRGVTAVPEACSAAGGALGKGGAAVEERSCSRSWQPRSRAPHHSKPWAAAAAPALALTPVPAPDRKEAAVSPAVLAGLASQNEWTVPGGGVPGVQLVSAVAVLLNIHCLRASRAGPGATVGAKASPFHKLATEELSIHDYLSQIRKLLRCSRECFILALIYIDRFVERSPEVALCDATVHRLLLASLCVASKFLDDKGEDNAEFAKVGGIANKELNDLELLFLKGLDWRLHVSKEVYERYRDLVLRVVAGA